MKPFDSYRCTPPVEVLFSSNARIVGGRYCTSFHSCQDTVALPGTRNEILMRNEITRKNIRTLPPLHINKGSHDTIKKKRNISTIIPRSSTSLTSCAATRRWPIHSPSGAKRRGRWHELTRRCLTADSRLCLVGVSPIVVITVIIHGVA